MDIRRNLDAISNDLKKFGVRKDSNKESTGTRSRATGAFVNVTSIIGRDEDKRKIIDLLLGASIDDDGQIPAISIVGIGGLGKTTLARLVYNDNNGLESCKFDLKLWVSDSQQFDLKLLLQKILESIMSSDGMNSQDLELNSLQARVRKEISRKKYLLVLDDVENESRREWIELEELLKYGAEGSRILVTTRSRRVAKVMSSDSMIYELKSLSIDDSWLLFERMAFKGRKDDKLAQIGRDIFQKCGGVPLAIKTIGCLLYGQADKKWERIRNKELGNIDGDSNDIIPILRMSYDALDPKSKECFRYCALFPKSQPFSKEMLINIWMSNVSTETNRGEEADDVWDEIIGTLYDRCFLERKKKENGDDDEYFKMHDLMHDLAKQVAGPEMFVVGSDVTVDSGTLELEESVRHLSLTPNTNAVEHISRIEPKGSRLRTLLHHIPFTWYLSNPWEKLVSVDQLKSGFPMLRMLDLQRSNIESLPDSVGELIHLRYLDLSRNNMSTLPDSIGKLWNLQSLLLSRCRKLEKLPVGIRKLINLQQLEMEGCVALSIPMPSGMGAMISLHTLSMFIVGLSEDSAKLEDLETLSKLRLLKIKLPETMLEQQGGGGAFLSSLKRLKTLRVEWSMSRGSEVDVRNDMDILTKLQPSSALKELNLIGYEGLRFPLWSDDLTSSLPDLVKIEITNVRRCKHLPSFSGLQSLESVVICDCSSLEYVEENAHVAGRPFFPSLKHFQLERLAKLKGWCRELGTGEQSSLLPYFPPLSYLIIGECPGLRLTSIPASRMGKYNVVRDVQGDVPNLTIMVGDNLSCHWGKFNPDVPCDLAQMQPALPNEEHMNVHPGEFFTDDVQLYMSTPWEQFLCGNQASMLIKGKNVFNVKPISMVEGSFRRMSKCEFSLEIHLMPLLKTFPKVLRLLASLQELYITNCPNFTGEEDKNNHSSSTELSRECSVLDVIPQTWKGFESLRRLTLINLPKLARLPNDIQSLTSLQVLQIYNCMDLKVLPTEVPKMTNLKWICLNDCDEWESPILQSLHQYKWLKHVELCLLPELEYIQDDNNNLSLSNFPSLESVKLIWLPKLKGWSRMVASDNEQSLFPHLSRLEISKCRNLKGVSMLLSSAKVIICGDNTSEFFKSSLPSCTFVSDENSLYKTVLWEQHLQDKQLSLALYRSGFQDSWEEQDLGRVSSSITSFQIRGSYSIHTPKELKYLTALQKLSFEGHGSRRRKEDEEDNDAEAPWWGGLTSLTYVEFRNIPKMETLPEWIQFIPSLHELQISHCDTSLQIPEWVHQTFHKVSLPHRQGFRLLRKS